MYFVYDFNNYSYLLPLSVILIDYFTGMSCPLLDVHPGRAWSSSPACTWHCSLLYLFIQASPSFPHCVTIACYGHTDVVGSARLFVFLLCVCMHCMFVCISSSQSV